MDTRPRPRTSKTRPGELRNDHAEILYVLEFESCGVWYQTVTEPRTFRDFTEAAVRAHDMANTSATGTKYRVAEYLHSRVVYE